jgi:hypothetical protein
MQLRARALAATSYRHAGAKTQTREVEEKRRKTREEEEERRATREHTP